MNLRILSSFRHTRIVGASTSTSRERILTHVGAAEDVHDWAGKLCFEEVSKYYVKVSKWQL